MGRTIRESKPRYGVIKDGRPDVMTFQGSGPDVYQDVGQEVTSSKMEGGKNLAKRTICRSRSNRVLLNSYYCGYSLEPPRRGGSNVYHNLYFEQNY